MNTSAKISNLRRELVNEYNIPEETQLIFVDIYNEVIAMEKRNLSVEPEKKKPFTTQTNTLEPGGIIASEGLTNPPFKTK